MALASDEDGFLKGRPLDLGRTLELWRELRSDLAHIKEMLRKGMASSEPDAPRESPAPAQQPLERTSPVVVQPIGKAADRGLAQALEAVAAIAARAMPESAMPSMPSGKVPVDMPARPIGAGGTPKSDARAPAPDPKTAPLLEKIKRGIESQEATIEKGLIALRKAIEDLIDATRWAKKDDSGGGLLDKLPGLLGKGAKLAKSALGKAGGVAKSALGKAGGLLKKLPIRAAGPAAAILGAIGLAADFDAADSDETLTERGRTVKKGEAVGKFGGTMAGSAAGAMAGAALGPVGMLAGAIIGGAIGAWGGSKAGGAITDAVLDPEAPGTLPGPAPGRGVPGTASETPPDAASGPRTQADRRASRSGGGDAGPAQTSRPGPNATASGTGKRFGDNVETAIADASQKHGVSHEFMRAMATIESGGNPNAVSPTGASGLYQFTQRTGKGYGLIDAQGDRRFDARANADAAARLSIDNRRALKKKGIENPTDFDAYMAHQQGATGWARIKKGGAVSSEIRNNMDNNGGRGKTSEEFVAHWERMFAKKVAGTGYAVQDGMVVAPGTVAAAQAASQQSTEAQQATSAPGPTPPEAVQSAQAAAAAPAQIAAAQPTSAPGQPFGQPTSAPATQAPSGTSLQASVPPAQPATESSASATPGAFAPQQTAQGAQQQPASAAPGPTPGVPAQAAPGPTPGAPMQAQAPGPTPGAPAQAAPGPTPGVPMQAAPGPTPGVPMQAAPGQATKSVIRRINQGATRNKDITPELESRVHEAVRAVYGDGATADLYSGGQDAKGKGTRRTGSTRHDDGKAGDFYIKDAQGRQIKGDELGKIGQYWTAKGYGGVGMEMRGGGIHLDEHTDRAKAWGYADKGGRYSPAQKAAIARGMRGEMPELKLDPAIAALPNAAGVPGVASATGVPAPATAVSPNTPSLGAMTSPATSAIPPTPGVPGALSMPRISSAPTIQEALTGVAGLGYGDRKDDNTPVVGAVGQDVRDRRIAHIVTGGIGASL